MVSILDTIKTMLGIPLEEDHFNSELIVDINMALATLIDLGFGPQEGFSITGPDEAWDDFSEDEEKINLAKSYVHLKTKLLFDPPSSSFVLEAFKQNIAEYEWRINKDL